MKDLYQGNEGVESAQKAADDLGNNGVDPSQTSLDNFSFDLNFAGFHIDIISWVYHFNLILLSWYMLRSVLGWWDFRHNFFRASPNDNFIRRTKKAKIIYRRAILAWLKYATCLGLYAAAVVLTGNLGSAFSIIALAAYVFTLGYEIYESPLTNLFKGEDATLLGRATAVPVKGIKNLISKIKS